VSGREINIVFEGGGVKGVGLIGALAVLEERGYRFRHVAGSSAGAIVASLLAAGYSAGDLLRIAVEVGFGDFRDRDWIDRIPVLGKPVSLVKEHGIYEGRCLAERMRLLLEAKGVRRFGDLTAPALGGSLALRHRAQVIVSDLTERSLLVLPRDADKLGIDPDDLDVALAVRMSASIPLFFEPVRFINPRTGRQHVLVDGGLLSNFPVWLFDDAGDPSVPTIGIRLDEGLDDLPAPGEGIVAVIDFVRSLAQTVVSAHDRRYLEQSKFDRVISVPSLGVRTADFELSPERAMALYWAGREAAGEFLSRWERQQRQGADQDASAGAAAAA
jgi:NTE family protein